MDYIIKCSEEQKQILQIALYGYLNRYRLRLDNIEDNAYKLKIKEKISMTEKMLSEIGS